MFLPAYASVVFPDGAESPCRPAPFYAPHLNSQHPESAQKGGAICPMDIWLNNGGVEGALIVAWDATALSLALPVIAEQLHATNFQSFWASIAFILGIAVTQPIYASISDVVDRKPALYASVILFGVESVVFATAKDMNIVVAGRLIKGLGVGGLDVLQSIILCDITTIKERPRWLGVMSMANAVGAVIEPFIGGVFAQHIGWPWLGWINLVVVGITGVLTFFFFLHLTPIEGNLMENMRKLDWYGFALFTTIFLGLGYTIGAESRRAHAYAFQALLGAGLGIAMMAGLIAVLANVEKVDDEGQVVGMLVTARFLGLLIGLTTCSTVFSSMFHKGLSSLESLPEQVAVLEDASQAVGFIPRLSEIQVPEEIMHRVIGAYEDAFQTIWVVLAALAALGVLAALCMKERSLEKEDTGRQGFKAPSSE
ncbi:hypothetical protein GRF29_216g1033717 [Pseudopithomyces chartarum]|uniref:Major facilitator superfamily (MFS) profile domain-containing protein n=1 Tax=Pseudopithomyces chartarum TaxID=1892770 RepID=A0AAN6LLW7_9PLEO|nr:hypothetical protein GRF29_216g1033717 [Pseudopithomyces chartarum]